MKNEDNKKDKEIKQLRKRVKELEKSETKRLSAEQAGKKADEERNRILKLSYDLICIAGMDGYFKYVNPAWERTLGYTSEELLSKPFLDFIHPDDHNINDAEVEKLSKGEQTIGFENRYIHKDGSVRTISWTATPLEEEKQIYCIGRDITERKQAEEELRLKNLVFEASIAANSTADNEGIITHANPAFLRFWGYDLIEEVIGKSILHFLKYKEETVALVNALNETGAWEGEYTALKKDGTTFIAYGLATTILNEKGEQIGVQSSVLDITEQKQAEEKLGASRERLRFLLSTSSAVVYSSKATGDFGATFISDNIKSQLGYDPEEYLKDSSFWVEHIHPEDRDRVLANLSDLFKKGYHVHEYRFAMPDGTYHWMRDELILIRDEYGNPKECVGCWLDINERKKAEEELQKLKDKLEIKVAEQTKELRKRINELERFRDATVNREFRMKELRDEIERLKKED